ncbi:putative glycoside hydrolase [Jidongwangia harbinensis]|uniref:putative glycoside hydrolase n=1 Tax=Jidongwangia harbinensis TaxID=2878561 RepID=UPI001CD9EBAB|nr:putative glycoside hydrolase [Jidongwangia harbinensis]MCA2215463.1 putative glycoside hydrolase family 15 protein [Jidongwangia harbinensis]
MTQRRFGAWIRYGDPVRPDQLQFAVDHCATAVLQPWETAVAAELKRARPDMVVLAYKCLSSTRSYEPGPCFSSGVGHAEAEAAGEHLFAHRAADGSRIQWRGYPGHWQMAVWEREYRDRWTANVIAEIGGTVWDGVMADNDVFDDYYGLEPPLDGGYSLPEVRAGLDALIADAGRALIRAGKILVPNIAESRREPGRWQRHAAYGGGFEEVWLAWAPDQFLASRDAIAQAECLDGPGLSILRTASDGTADHPNIRYGLAACWIFGGGRDGVSFTATAHDQYNGTPSVGPLWDLGVPVTDIGESADVRFREFTEGWAAVHLGSAGDEPVRIDVPAGLVDDAGRTVPGDVVLAPRTGVLLRRP